MTKQKQRGGAGGRTTASFPFSWDGVCSYKGSEVGNQPSMFNDS